MHLELYGCHNTKFKYVLTSFSGSIMKNIQNIEFDSNDIKVPFDELFFDIIYVIVISKISSLVLRAGDITPSLIFSCFILFGSLVWVWFFRVNQLNGIHILQHRLGDFNLKSENLTYIEILVLISILFSMQIFNFQIIILIVFVCIIITTISLKQLRKKIVSNASTHHKFYQLHNRGEISRFTKMINCEYIFERFGIVFVLFMGEILSVSFTNINRFSTFFVIACLVLGMYKNNIEILNKSKQLIATRDGQQLYKNTINYAKSLIILLLSIIVSIEVSGHLPGAKYIAVISLIIYFVFETRMRKMISFKIKSIIYIINILLIAIIMFNIDLDPKLMILLGICSLVSTFDKIVMNRIGRYRR